MNEKELMREMIAFAGHKFDIRIDGQQLIALLATIQLACRHPNFRGATRQQVEQIAHSFQRLAAAAAPDLDLVHDVLKLGWNPDYDVHHPHPPAQPPAIITPP